MDRRPIPGPFPPARRGAVVAPCVAAPPDLLPALLPLPAPPQGPGWNHALVADWLADAPRIPAAVLVAVRTDPAHHVIFTRRNESLAQHAGQVAFPGGSVDADDRDIVATALREAEEEVGLPAAAVTPLGYLDCFETISGFLVTPVVALVAPEASLVAAPGEVAEVFEVPLAFFREPRNRRHYAMDWHGQRRPMVEFQFAGHRIWGATAAMLCNLLTRMDAVQ